ncbi:Alpha/Beta hydrolase protein [Hyaloraphidium curvatum]|nr:Alpha/Beta hydrolase protein [Hyaloraphidium curvatum]
MTSEVVTKDVTFYSEGYRLGATLFLPGDLAPGERRPGIVLITGYMGTRDMYLPGMAAELCRAGRYICVTFDFKGWGDSQPAPYPNRLAPFSRVLDAQAAATYLSLHEHVDPNRLAAYGISFGGLTSVFLQAIDRRIKCIAVVASGVAPPPGSPEAKAEAAAVSAEEKAKRAAQALDLRKIMEAERRRNVLEGTSEPVARDRIMRMDERSKQRSEAQRKSLASGPAVTSVPGSFLEETSQFPPDLLRAVAPLAKNAIFVSSEADAVLPPAHAKQLYDRIGGEKAMHVLPKEKDCDHFAMYEADNVRDIVRGAIIPAFEKWFAAEDSKASKSKM